MTATTKITPAEMIHLKALWERPIIKAGSARNPLIKAMQETMARTGDRWGWHLHQGTIVLTLTAFEISAKGMPKGTGRVTEAAVCASADEAVAFLSVVKPT